MKDYHLQPKPLEQITLDDFNPSLGKGLVNFWIPSYSDICKMSQVFKLASGKEKPVVADVGFGSGLVSLLLAQQGLIVYAFDGNPNLVSEAQRTYAHPNLTFIPRRINRIPKAIDNRRQHVDGVYCSFMPEGENWSGALLRLNPSAIVHIVENQGERLLTGTEESYRAGQGYSKVGGGPYFSYRDLATNFQSIIGTGSIFHVQDGNPKESLLRGFKAINSPAQQYPWEAELEARLRKAEEKPKTPSRTSQAR